MEIKKDFNKLRHTFFKEEIDKFRKSFYVIENHKNVCAEEIKEAIENFIELENSLQFKKFYDDDYYEYKKIKSVRRLFEGFNKDYYKPIKTDDSFGDKKVAT